MNIVTSAGWTSNAAARGEWGSPERGHQLCYLKTLKTRLLYTGLFVFKKLSLSCTVFHMTRNLSWIEEGEKNRIMHKI
jgi:hypothetical protein